MKEGIRHYLVAFSKDACLILFIGIKKQPMKKRGTKKGKEKGYVSESQ